MAHLRSVAGRYPDDPGLARLLEDLHAGSAEFRELWADADAGTWRSHTKTVEHPTLGELVLDCDSLHVPDVDQRLIVYSAAPGSPAARPRTEVRAADQTKVATASAARRAAAERIAVGSQSRSTRSVRSLPSRNGA